MKIVLKVIIAMVIIYIVAAALLLTSPMLFVGVIVLCFIGVLIGIIKLPFDIIRIIKHIKHKST